MEFIDKDCGCDPLRNKISDTKGGCPFEGLSINLNT